MSKWYPYADLVLKNARVYTVDLTIPEIQARKYDFTVIENGYVAVKDGKFIGVGEGLDESLIGPQTEVIDEEGKTIVPGLMDSHMHALMAGGSLSNVQLDKCTTLQEMLDALKQRAEVTPAGKYIMGTGWNELSWTDGKIPDRRALDTVSTEHPIVTMRTCHHIVLVNSKFLEVMGITEDTPDPEGGKLGRYEDGTLNGWFYDSAAMQLYDSMPDPTEEDLCGNIEAIGKYMNSVGLTSVIDCNNTFDGMRAYGLAYQKGQLSYRCNMSYSPDAVVGEIPTHLNRVQEMTAVTGFGNDMLKFNGLKVVLDGVPAAGTAYMRKNYKHMPETRGYTTITPEQMAEVCRCASKYNWQMAIHAIGDAAIDVALDALAEGAKEKDNRKNRNYIIHCVFPREDAIEKMKDLEVSATLQPTIMGCMGEEAVLDEDCKALNQPCGLFFDNHIVCGGSTDFPIVDCNPFLGMSKAITRVGLDGQVHGPQYRVSAKQALIMWTMNSAYFSFDENKLGSIEVGKLADMVVIDTPILDVEPEKIAETKVYTTYLAGKPVYQR